MTRGRPSPWPLVAVLLAARLSAARPDCATEPCGAAALMPRDDGRFPLSAAFDLSAALAPRCRNLSVGEKEKYRERVEL